MSFTYGFFNSLNHDRLYDADEFSRIFDGMLRDGIYSTIGTCMIVTANTGMIINVGVGRAYFNTRWMYNDSIMPLGIEQSSQVLNRYDAVVIEVNNDPMVRECNIRVIKGEDALEPVKPEMIKTESMFQYPLAYIYVKANTEEIGQDAIENMVGTSACPFVTGILQQLTTDELLLQWKEQYNLWTDSRQADFEGWFRNLKNMLDDNQAGHLQNEIDDLIDRMTAFEKSVNKRVNDSTVVNSFLVPVASWGSTADRVGEVVSTNYLPYPYFDSSRTRSGVTYTVNKDGTVKANGTATAEGSVLYLASANAETLYELEPGSYMLCGAPYQTNGTEIYRGLRLQSVNPETKAVTGVIANDYGYGEPFEIESKTAIQMTIFISPNRNVDNVVFKPMIVKMPAKKLSPEIGGYVMPYERYFKITDSLKTDYAYVASVVTDVFNAESAPEWRIDGTNGMPVGDQLDSSRVIARAYYNTKGVTIFSLDAPLTDVVLVTKGV